MATRLESIFDDQDRSHSLSTLEKWQLYLKYLKTFGRYHDIKDQIQADQELGNISLSDISIERNDEE